MINIVDMTPREFQNFLKKLKVYNTDVVEEFMDEYFFDFKDSIDPIVEAYDCDRRNFMDAKNHMQKLMDGCGYMF